MRLGGQRVFRCWMMGSIVLGIGILKASPLPDGFEQSVVVSGLRSPSALEFGPDDRLYIAERVAGEIRVVSSDGDLDPDPILRLDIPRTDEGELPGGRGYKSSGARGFVFDPDYPDSPFLYVFYMENATRHNRVSRFRIRQDPLRADPETEEVLIELPFHEDRSSGSHNGGALIFDEEGRLYVTTGDGWNGGNPVQSLETFTGKVFRLEKDGRIPEDNPFYDQTSGSYRAIYALGFRNPYTIARHPESGELFVNDCAGPRKANIYRLTAGGNYGYARGGSVSEEQAVGRLQEPHANGAVGRWARLVTGGAWYPTGGPFPEKYWGSYFVALWGMNAPVPGKINRLISRQKPEAEVFLDAAGGEEDPDNPDPFITSAKKPVYTKVGPDGALYWLATTYRTWTGTVYKITYQGEP